MRKILIIIPLILLSCKEEIKKTPEQLEDERRTREYNEKVKKINASIDSLKVIQAENKKKLELIRSIK